MAQKKKAKRLGKEKAIEAHKLLGLNKKGTSETEWREPINSLSGEKRNKYENEICEFLNCLETDYEVLKIPYKDFATSGMWDITKKKTLLTHAGKIYSLLLLRLFEIASKEKMTLYLKKAENFYLSQIEKHEEQPVGPNRNRLRQLSIELSQIYLGAKEYKKFAEYYMRSLQVYVIDPDDDYYDRRLKERLKAEHAEAFWQTLLQMEESKLKQFSEAGMKIFGDDPDLLKSFCLAIYYAQDEEPCLLIGETGTGKEIVANFMHLFSPRQKNNFVTRNIAAYPDTLFDSEIFGVKRGAYTGAESNRLGVLLSACGNSNKDCGYTENSKDINFRDINGNKENEPSWEQLKELAGTVLLDEINSISPAAQAKLLRAIQQKEVQILGEDRVRKFDAKIICAANNEGLSGGTKWGGRKDFFYRFKQVIILPSLREMRGSIPKIAKLELENIAETMGFESKKISPKAMDKLQKHTWPGNFRELSHVLYGAALNADLRGNSTIRFGDIEFLEMETDTKSIEEQCFGDLTWDEIHVKYAEYLLERHGGNKIKAGKAAGKKSKQFIDTGLKKKAEMMKKTS